MHTIGPQCMTSTQIPNYKINLNGNVAMKFLFLFYYLFHCFNTRILPIGYQWTIVYGSPIPK